MENTNDATKLKVKVPNEETSLEALVRSFDSLLFERVRDAWQDEPAPNHFDRLLKMMQELESSAKEIGDHAFYYLEQEDRQDYQYYFIDYEWSEQIKFLLLLIRDILFQEQKAFLYVCEGFTKKRDYDALKVKSRESLLDAANQLKEFYDTKIRNVNAQSAQVALWYHQQNPWPIYRDQLELLPKQTEEIKDQFLKLWNASGGYVVINLAIAELVQAYVDDIYEMRKGVQVIKGDIEVDPETVKYEERIQQLEKIYADLADQDGQQLFKNKLDEQLDKLPGTLRTAVNVKNGFVQYKDLNYSRMTKAWLESEVMPELYDFFSLQENILNRFKLLIVNLKNKIALEKQEGKTDFSKDILLALNNLLESQEISTEKLADIRKEVLEQLNAKLKISKVYQEDFLSISIQSTIDQYRRSQIKGLRWFRDWIAEKGYFVRQYQKHVEAEDKLSISERIVRVVRNRTCDVNSSQYTSMFFTSGFIGSSFQVGREDELAHVRRMVDNWQLGFRGALMISGKRFSGKTLFGELIKQQFPDTEFINIQPNTRITIAGRHLEVEYDLEAVLDFVIKHKLQEQVFIWIDNLEFWRDDKISLGQNIRSLLKKIDRYSNRIFFIVAANDWLMQHLIGYYAVDRVFQTRISMNQMSVEEIQEAILIRHSATQLKLIDENGDSISANKLKQRIDKIYRLSEGVVGEALHRWAYSSLQNADEVSQGQDLDYVLPNSISTDAGILLSNILMEKRTNEYQLRKRFGPAFRSTYQTNLQRLMHLGMVTRNPEGWLQINEPIVNELAGILAKNNFVRTIQ